MDYQSMLDIIVALPFDTMTTVYSNNSQSIIVYRPSKLSERFKNYNVNKNFQIFLRIGDAKPLRPNHLRLLLDLKLRSRDLPAYKNKMLFAFDKIFYKDDPLSSIKPLMNIPFTQYINPLDITAVLAQLFIIEQNIGYSGKSTFEPPSLYIHPGFSEHVTILQHEKSCTLLISCVSALFLLILSSPCDIIEENTWRGNYVYSKAKRPQIRYHLCI